MKKNINGINLCYDRAGTKGKPVLLFHGWGQNKEMMKFISDSLCKQFIVYNFDLPGFGESDIPPAAWGYQDYADFFHDFCVAENIDNPILIGHSFGSRIAFGYAYKYPTYKMCLTGAAGIKNKRGFIYYLKLFIFKFFGLLFKPKVFKKYHKWITNLFGSTDYKNANGVMKGVLVKVVNEDIKPILSNIECVTLLVFGENDDITLLWQAKIIEQEMPNATLVIFENDDHFAYFNQARRFVEVLRFFLNDDHS